MTGAETQQGQHLPQLLKAVQGCAWLLDQPRKVDKRAPRAHPRIGCNMPSPISWPLTYTVIWPLPGYERTAHAKDADRFATEFKLLQASLSKEQPVDGQP